jgi:hypothetical protein
MVYVFTLQLEGELQWMVNCCRWLVASVVVLELSLEVS